MIPKHCEVCRQPHALLWLQRLLLLHARLSDPRLANPQTHLQANQRQAQGGPNRGDKIRARRGLLPLDDPNVNGVFWRHVHLRPYLQAKFLYGEFLVRSWRRQGVEDSLKQYLDILHRNRPDNQGARGSVPGLFIRFDQDQEAYDLIYWRAQDGPKGLWLGRPLPALSGRQECRRHRACRLVVPLLSPAHARRDPLPNQVSTAPKPQRDHALTGDHTPRQSYPDSPTPTRDEILSVLKGKYQCAGNVVDNQPVVDFYNNESLLVEKMNHLLQQMTQLYYSADKDNKHIWGLITDPTEEAFSARPVTYNPGSWNEAQIAFAHLYPAWAESVAAVPALT